MSSASHDPAVWIKEALAKPGPDGRNMGQLIVARAVSEALKGSHKSRDWLFNRAYGRPAQQIEISNGPEVDVRQLIMAALTSPPQVVATPPVAALIPPWEDAPDEPTQLSSGDAIAQAEFAGE